MITALLWINGVTKFSTQPKNLHKTTDEQLHQAREKGVRVSRKSSLGVPRGIIKFIYAERFLLFMTQTFNVIVEQGEDGYLISEVVGLPGCHTQAKTYDELIKRTKEAIRLYLKAKEIDEEGVPKFIGLQQIEVEA